MHRQTHRNCSAAEFSWSPSAELAGRLCAADFAVRCETARIYLIWAAIHDPPGPRHLTLYSDVSMYLDAPRQIPGYIVEGTYGANTPRERRFGAYQQIFARAKGEVFCTFCPRSRVLLHRFGS